VLSDGSYEAFVIDAAEHDDGSLRLELTILSGDHRSEVVTVHARGLSPGALEIIGLPATINVRDGHPGVEIGS
jgi:hypothetical protein